MESNAAEPSQGLAEPVARKKFLNSWKQIARYLGRGVRTVQRWERELALPVRRPRGRPRSAVIALTAEIDAWLERRPQLTLGAQQPRAQQEAKRQASAGGQPQ